MNNRKTLDPVLLEVMRSAFYSVADEMTAALVRTAYSTNIKDRRDCSAAIFLPDGQVVAQSELGVPLHLGIMSAVVQMVLARYALNDMAPGDDIMINTPYPAGPGHLNDITLVSPVFFRGDVIALVANMAHHVDVGGSVPGSMPANSTEIFQEGLQIPPVKIVKQDQLDQELLAIFLSNIRTGEQGRGDLMAQVAANNVGEKRIIELTERYGLSTFRQAMIEIMAYSERRMRAAIRQIPNGTYSFQDYLEWPPAPGGRLTIKATVTVEDEAVSVDFAGTSPQVKGPLNCRRQTAETCTYYVLKALLDPGLPPNSGAYRPVRVRVPEGSLLHARFPASIVHSNIITSQRIVDVLLGAFLQAMPERAAAASSGTMNLIIIGGVDPQRGEYFSYVETYGGGQGAMPDHDGMSGVHTHMTNTRNAPVEVIEATFPLQVERYGLVADSEGAGRFRGGLGMVREVRMLTDATLTVASDRQEIGPWAVDGGQPGSPALCVLKRRDGAVEPLPSKVTIPIQAGDRVITITPGGGGWGDPTHRLRQAVEQDVHERLISVERARAVYGYGGLGTTDRVTHSRRQADIMNGGKTASQRVVGIQPSATVMVSDRARAMAQQGLDVINLGGGDPDFDTPSHIVQAGLEAMRQGHTHYVSSQGLKALRTAIADKLQNENDLAFNPETEIIVTPGAKLGLYAAIMAVVDDGDEVLIPDPFWVSYEACVRLAGGVPVRVPLRREQRFHITSAVLLAKLTPRSKLLLLNSPNNPTGRVLRREELETIAEFVLERDLWILSDEIYEKIIYDGHQHISIGSLPDMLERTIIVNGFSKSYAMTGWRLGYVAARERLAKQILKVQQHSVTCASSFTQFAGLAALTGSQEPVLQMVEAYRKRRDIITDGLNSLPGVSCHRPEGAFYALPDISQTGMSSTEFAEMLLDKARVAVTPGIAFGDSGEGHVRLSFATSTELIERAIERTGAALH